MSRATPSRVVARLLGNVEQAGGCLISTYSTGSHGYSQIGWYDSSAGRSHMALGHRVAWEAEHGPIPEGLTVDHICRNRRCVNIEHLRLLSNVDNARDNGMARRTHCPQGHEYDEANTHHDAKGHRKCRACAADRRAA
jgi:hypothetical protein